MAGLGGEQGDPLTPALISLAQHRALVEASSRSVPGERVFAYLDDLYIVTTRERARAAFEVVSETVERVAGVRTHLGKLRAWSSGGGSAPPGIEALGKDVWTADKVASENGLKILGTPLGKQAFVDKLAHERIAAEKEMLEQIEKMSDLQSAFVMLSMSAVPRANHMIRMLPPSKSLMYA